MVRSKVDSMWPQASATSAKISAPVAVRALSAVVMSVPSREGLGLGYMIEGAGAKGGSGTPSCRNMASPYHRVNDQAGAR